MGAGIAQLALEAGHDVRIYDVDPAALVTIERRIREGLARRAARLDLDADAIDDWVDGRSSRLLAVAALEAVAGTGDLVIEAAIEDLDAKRAVFHALDRDAPPRAILATNTSALSVGAIAEATTRPSRVLGLHFFNPAPVMRLVEVVATGTTDPEQSDRAVRLMERWGRTPVRSADTPGFIVNRINRPFTLEPLAVLEHGGTTAPAIDRAMREAGYPMGPFELLDLIGLDVNLAVTQALHVAAQAVGDPLSDRFRPSPLQERLVAAGRLGRKAGRGFHRYDADGRVVAPPDADSADPVSATVPERVTLAIVDEAYRAAGEAVASPADIDTALRLGAGHPMGPFERVEAMGGAGAVLARLHALADPGPRFVPAAALVDATAR
jgi:3-hydroxybutyryl-CoA dehydrogenase